MRASLLLAGSALGILVGATAAAQDTPPNPPEAPSPPAEAPTPPAEPAPTPPPSTPPPVVLPESPEEPPPSKPPVKPPPKEVKPADITLEETPEEPRAGKKPKAHKAPQKHPKAEPAATEPEPEPRPEAEPGAAGEQAGEKPAKEKPEGEDEAKDKEKKDDGEGLLGPFRIGIILGAGLPSIVSFGGMIKLTRYFGAGVNVGLIPSIRLAYYGEADLAYQEYDIYGRIFPFGGALFAGAGVGYAHAAGSFRASYDTSMVVSQNPMLAKYQVPPSLSIASEASVRVMVLTPTIGLLHTFGSGFTIGIDAGAQIPIAPSETRFDTSVPVWLPPNILGQVRANDQQVRDTLDTMSRTIIPTLNIRVGWLI